MIDFSNISYLKLGTSKQQRAYKVLTDVAIVDALRPFDPVLAGTIPLNIDTEASDLDIICCWQNKDAFIYTLQGAFGNHSSFRLREKLSRGYETVIANFMLTGFEVEIFGQSRPTKEQEAYRHMLVEYKLLCQYGEAFRHQVVSLKKQGLKTEPAFAQLLGLLGDPYLALLELNV